MERLVYEAPDGTLLFEPSPEQITEVIRRADHRYWLQGGNGEAAIRVAKRPGDGRRVSHAVTEPDGTRVEYAAGEPELWIKQPEPGMFFFTWDCQEGWIVPYDGSDCDAFVTDERGGDPFKVPRACLVDEATAVDVVCEFLRTRRRSGAVRWVPWSELPLPPEW